MCEDWLERGTPLQVDRCGEVLGLDRTGELGLGTAVTKEYVDSGGEMPEWVTEPRRDDRGAACSL